MVLDKVTTSVEGAVRPSRHPSKRLEYLLTHHTGRDEDALPTGTALTQTASLSILPCARAGSSASRASRTQRGRPLSAGAAPTRVQVQSRPSSASLVARRLWHCGDPPALHPPRKRAISMARTCGTIASCASGTSTYASAAAAMATDSAAEESLSSKYAALSTSNIDTYTSRGNDARVGGGSSPTAIRASITPDGDATRAGFVVRGAHAPDREKERPVGGMRSRRVHAREALEAAFALSLDAYVALADDANASAHEGSQGAYPSSPRTMRAAHAFDARHRAYTLAARRSLVELE